MADSTDLAKVFGGGSGGAAPGGPSSDEDDPGELPGDDAESDADAPPPDFALNAAEAFPDLAGDDARIEALYRTIKSCHPVS